MKRRQFLIRWLTALFLISNSKWVMSATDNKTYNYREIIKLFLCGDVMTGRGIDQVLPYHVNPRIHEPYVKNAQRYVELAEQLNGSISKPVEFSYIWGDALTELERISPDVRIINLETSVTTSDKYWHGKGINYRMHPKNVPCLTVAGIDCCVLANNHVLDWGYEGLEETLKSLHNSNLKSAGAGLNAQEAASAAIMEIEDKGRVIVFSYGMESSGIVSQMAAKKDRPGINLLMDLSSKTIKKIRKEIQAIRRPGDLVVVSIHWGGNWGYHIPREHVQFAHQLIDDAAVDVVHGHSSHHAKGIEVYKDKPVIYGCGDFLNDYEGIGGYEEYRDDLVLMYILHMLPAKGKLVAFEMVPFQIKRFSLNRISAQDALWLRDTLAREGKQFGNDVKLNKDLSLSLEW